MVLPPVWPIRWRKAFVAAAVGAAAVVSTLSAGPAAAGAGMIQPPAALPTTVPSSKPTTVKTPHGELAPVYPGQVGIPKQAPISRSVETAQDKLEQVRGYALAKHIGKHPYYAGRKYRLRRPFYPQKVKQPTKREEKIRSMLRLGENVSNEEFDKVIQVFAQRSRQDLVYGLSFQRRLLIQKAKGWAYEMLLQKMKPSRTTVQVLMLGFAANSDFAGAISWLKWLNKKTKEKAGPLEYNAVIQAFSNAGQPLEAATWFKNMERAGFRPDARSYASLMNGWEKIGNRHEMLRLMVKFREAEKKGELGDSGNPRDAGLPYYALARSYAKVGDAVRAMSILKAVKNRGVPLSTEAYRLRLRALAGYPSNQQTEEQRQQIMRAFVDLVKRKSEKFPVMSQDLFDLARTAIGFGWQDRIQRECQQMGCDFEDLVPPEKNSFWLEKYKEYNVLNSYKMSSPQKPSGRRHRIVQRYLPGLGPLFRRNNDNKMFLKKVRQRQEFKIGPTKSGLERMETRRGLPEWMKLKKPVIYGKL
eukprot:TRINITY_DN27713_c0_g1_i1.p1 TRINITY_DN27713_c0_g1~~TRINITY_DN27713_c0_g1_i1.p1  ORF type:complete len:529 (+),score=73.40 TRINITY_DN27713_c0_g1_i1:71-1657(+)